MRARIRAALAGVWLGCVGCAGPSLPVPSVLTSGAPGATSASEIEPQVHAGVNRYRQSRGLGALVHDDRLAALARHHSEAIAAGRRPFSHDGFDDRAAASSRNFPLRSFAENIALDRGPDPADGTYYFTQLFVGLDAP